MGVENKKDRETPIGRRRFLVGLGLGAAGATVAWLGIDRLLKGKPTPEQKVTPTEEGAPTSRQTATETVKPTSTNTSSPYPITTEVPKTPTPDYSGSDKGNWEKIQEAEGGEIVTFENPAITHIIKIPRPGPDAYFGLIKVQRQDGKFEYLVAENFDCEHQELLERGLLKEPLDIPVIPFGSGVWPVTGRPIERLNAKVFLGYAAGTIPWLISESFNLGGETKTISCPKTFSLPKDISERILKTTKPIIEEVIEFIKERVD